MFVAANLTLSVDERTVERARRVAAAQGTSLKALIRRYLEKLAGEQSGEDVAAELDEQWAERAGHGRGAKLNRAELYEERIGRTRVR